jgi:hypothetical protein
MTGFYTIGKDDKKVPYTFSSKKEYDEYLAVIEIIGIWGGIPCDVGWARGTNSYQEGLKTYNAKERNSKTETVQPSQENT